MSGSYRKPARRTFTDNYIGQIGAVVKGKGETFSVTFRNSTGSSKKIALFYGVMISLLARKVFVDFARDDENNIIGRQALLIGGEAVQINNETGDLTGSKEDFILYDNPELLKQFYQDIEAVWNDGVLSADSAISGYAIYGDANGYVAHETTLTSVNALQALIPHKTLLINSVKASANDPSVIEKASFFYKDLETMKGSGYETFNFSSYTSAMQNNASMTTIDTLKKNNKIIQLDANSLLVLNMPGLAGGTAEMTLEFNVTVLTDIARVSIEEAVKQLTNAMPSGMIK